MFPKILIFFILTFLHLSIQEEFDPTKFDYCKVKCYKPGIHSACECTPAPPREEVLDDVMTFRQEMLDAHNYWRNYLAVGEAAKEHPEAPAASDMLALNYDLELEYIVRCLAVNSFNAAHDACRDSHDSEIVGQNLAGCSERNFSMEMVKFLTKGWFDEIRFLRKDDVGKFVGNPPTGVIGHFTQLVWSQNNRVGCARLWNPKQPKKPWRFTLLCNYGTYKKGAAANRQGEPVYKKGAPCSACPSGTECDSNSTFPALCGKALPVPRDAPHRLGRTPTAEKPVEESVGKTTDKSVDESAAEKPIEESVGKTTDKSVDKSVNKFVDKSADKSGNKQWKESFYLIMVLFILVPIV